MAVIPMKRIFISAMQADRKDLLEDIQRKGVVEVTFTEDMPEKDTVFAKMDTSDMLNTLKQELKSTEDALNILRHYRKDKGSLFDAFLGPRKKTAKEYDEFYQEKPKVVSAVEEVIRIHNENLHIKEDSLNLKVQQKELAPWLSLEVPLDYTGSRYTACFIGSVRGELTKRAIREKILENQPKLLDVVVDIVSQDSEQTNIVVIGMKTQQDLLKDALNYIGFSYPMISGGGITPQKLSEEYSTQKIKGEEIFEENQLRLSQLAEYWDKLEMLEDHNRIRIEKYQVLGHLTMSRYTFSLEGYLPASWAEDIIEDFTNRYVCLVTVEDVSEEDNPPTSLENNWFSQPVERVVNEYGRPNYREIDPTTVMSFFYYILFGMMFSDAGYGLILVLVCGGLLLKFRNMPRDTSQFLRLFFWCGVSTVFWGFIFSSFFGDAITVISSTYFGKKVVLEPLWFSPMDDPMKLLMFCMGLGTIHLIAGYLMNGANAVLRKDYWAILFDTGFPILFLLGLLPKFIGSQIFTDLVGVSVAVSPMLAKIGIIVTIVSSIGIVLTGGRDSSSTGAKIAGGFYQLYNTVSGWLSDILSYSRLLALGLATGIIGSVINLLGSMLGKGVFSVIGFILIFLFGHTLNFAINILGSYVHSNRLGYVEFFGKFYQGDGRAYQPFSTDTKHYQIKEDE